MRSGDCQPLRTSINKVPTRPTRAGAGWAASGWTLPVILESVIASRHRESIRTSHTPAAHPAIWLERWNPRASSWPAKARSAAWNDGAITARCRSIPVTTAPSGTRLNTSRKPETRRTGRPESLRSSSQAVPELARIDQLATAGGALCALVSDLVVVAAELEQRLQGLSDRRHR